MNGIGGSTGPKVTITQIVSPSFTGDAQFIPFLLLNL